MRSFIPPLCLSIGAPLLTMPAEAQAPKHVATIEAPLPEAARDAAGVVEGFHRLLKSGSLEEVSAQLADSALIYESGGVERSKAEYTSHHLPADAAFAKATTRTVTRQSGNATANMAWIATESRTSGSYKSRAIDSVSTETMVLRREGKTWKIVHIHWSSGK